MKQLLFSIFMALATLSQAQVNIDQMIEAPGGGYIIFTDWGADYPIPGIQEYHKWSDLHLVDTFAIYSDSVCLSLFMDSVAMNCIQIPGIEGVCLDTFYVTPGDSLVLVECDGDSTFFAGGGGGPDLNGIFDSTNEGDTIEISNAEISSAIGSFTLSALGAANTSYWGYEPFAGGAGMIVYDDQNRSLVTLQNNHVSAGTFIDFYCGANTYNVGGNVAGDFYIQDGSIKPFYIATSATVNNSLKIQANGDLLFADYPNSRDDGTPTNFTGTDGSGTLQSYPVADMPENQNLTIEGGGPTYDIAIDGGTDVTIAGAGGITLSEGTPNVLTITQTADGDGSPTNEIQTLDASGTGPIITMDLSSDASDITITGSGAAALTATGNAITVGVSNEAIQDGVAGLLTGTQTGISVSYDDIGNMWDFVATDASVTNEITIVKTDNTTQSTGTVTLDFSTTDFGVAETPTDEFQLTVQPERIQDIVGAMFTGNTETGIAVDYQDSDGTIDLVVSAGTITAEEDNVVSETPVTVIDIGDGLDWNPSTGGEVDLQHDWGEFAVDGTADANEYVAIYDSDGPNQELRIATAFGADGNGMWTASNDNTDIANGTFEVGVPGYLDFRDGTEHDLFIDATNDRIGMGTNSPNYGLHIKNDAGMSLESFSDDTPPILKIESTEEGGTGIDSTLSNMIWAYTDTDYAAGAEQTAVDMGLYKFSDTGQRSVFKISMNEGTRSDAIVIEKEAAMTGSHQETLISFNGGFSNNQNYEWTGTSGSLALERGHFGVIVSGAGTIGNEVTLPNVFGNGDNWKSTMTATDCQVGQEYYITNLRASTGLIVRTNSGDFFRASATTINIPFGFTAHIRASRLNGTTGIWASWLSD